MNIHEEQFVVRGKDRFALGVEAARVSGAHTRAVVKVLSVLARRQPSILEAAHTGEAADAGTLAEVEGASRAMGLAADDLLAARRIMESLAMPACTNFGAVGPATEDGNVMTSWNFDVPPFFRLLFGRFPLFVREIEGSIPYLAHGIPALFGMGVMNAEGLTCVINAVGVTDDGDGYSPFELNNIAMETCTRVPEAARVFSERPRKTIKAMTVGVLMNWNTIWADADGNLSLFEYSHSHFNEHDATAQAVIASANHHQFLDRALSGGMDPNRQPLISGSYSRLARMYALLEEYRGRLGPKAAKEIVSDHIPDYSLLSDFGVRREWWEEKLDDSTICAHAWNVKKHLRHARFNDAFLEASFSTTLYSFQFQPRSMTSWFTNGHPCRNNPVPVYWGKLLGNEAERYPGALEPAELFGAKRRTDRRLIFSRDAAGMEALIGGAWMAMVRASERNNFN
jgi:hypothetical protein